MTPTIPLDLFPLGGPARILRWGPLSAPDCVIREYHGEPVAVDPAGGRVALPLVLPLRGTGLDAVLRSVGVALGWPVEEDGPAPRLVREVDYRAVQWVLILDASDGVRVCDFREIGGDFTVPGISTLSYPAAVAAVALAVAGRGGE